MSRWELLRINQLYVLDISAMNHTGMYVCLPSNMNINPCQFQFILGNMKKYICIFFIISHHWDGTEGWNHSAYEGLTHLPLVPHMCVGELGQLSIGLSNGLVPNRQQAITLTNADLLSIGPLGTNFNELQIKIQNFSGIRAGSGI